MNNPNDMLGSGNRWLLSILLRRYRTWPAADRQWLLNRLANDHHKAGLCPPQPSR